MTENEDLNILIEEVKRLIGTARPSDVQVVYRYLITSLIRSEN